MFILKFSGCLLAFLAFYRFFLEKESIHIFKRIYLLTAVILSAIIPFITFTEYVEAGTITNNIATIDLATSLEDNRETLLDYLPSILWTLYGLGATLFGVRLILNLKQIINRIRNNPKYKYLNYTNVLLQSEITPHTFFSYIFLNKKSFQNNEIPNEVLVHEQAHAQQKHSIDIVLLEFFQVLFWFNPLIYILKHYIKLNHEFLADQAVLNHGVATKSYQQTLLAFSSNALQPQLANAINYSLIKKRFTIMKTQTSKPIAWAKSLILLPLLAILIFSFSTKTIVEKETPTIELEDEIFQQKATLQQVAEYNKLAKYYNDNLDNKHITIKMKDVEKLKYIYSLMSESQRKSAQPFPNFPTPPPPPETPEVSDIKEVPPPPPPVPHNATPKQKTKYEKTIKEYKAKYNDVVKAPTPPKTPKAKEVVEVPPPPPPLNMEQLAKENAMFYYEGKKVSAKEALKIYNANKELNVQVIGYGKKQPTVKISKEPIKLKKKH